MEQNILAFIGRLNHPELGAPEDVAGPAAPLLLSPHFMLRALTPGASGDVWGEPVVQPKAGSKLLSDSLPRVFLILFLNWGCTENPKALRVWLVRFFYLYLSEL